MSKSVRFWKRVEKGRSSEVNHNKLLQMQFHLLLKKDAQTAKIVVKATQYN